MDEIDAYHICIKICKTFLFYACYLFMEITKIFITVATIVFTLLGFTYPIGTPFYWGYRGVSIILAIIGWLLVYQIWFK